MRKINSQILNEYGFAITHSKSGGENTVFTKGEIEVLCRDGQYFFNDAKQDILKHVSSFEQIQKHYKKHTGEKLMRTYKERLTISDSEK